MRRRFIITASLVCAMLVVALVSRYLLAVCALRLPSYFKYELVLNSHDNLFDPVKGVYEGEKRTLGTFTLENEAAYFFKARLAANFIVKSIDGKTIFECRRNYYLNRYRWTHTTLEDESHEKSYLFSPHFNNGHPYIYLHISYNHPIRLVYQKETTLMGMRVFEYASTFQTEQDKELKRIGVLKENEQSLLDVHLTVWVDPVTGWLIKYADEATVSIMDEGGNLLRPWNRFRNMSKDETVAAHVLEATTLGDKARLFRIWIPTALVICTVPLILMRLKTNT